VRFSAPAARSMGKPAGAPAPQSGAHIGKGREPKADSGSQLDSCRSINVVKSLRDTLEGNPPRSRGGNGRGILKAWFWAFWSMD
jgi:hypothetical protein